MSILYDDFADIADPIPGNPIWHPGPAGRITAVGNYIYDNVGAATTGTVVNHVFWGPGWLEFSPTLPIGGGVTLTFGLHMYDGDVLDDFRAGLAGVGGSVFLQMDQASAYLSSYTSSSATFDDGCPIGGLTGDIEVEIAWGAEWASLSIGGVECLTIPVIGPPSGSRSLYLYIGTDTGLRFLDVSAGASTGNVRRGGSPSTVPWLTKLPSPGASFPSGPTEAVPTPTLSDISQVVGAGSYAFLRDTFSTDGPLDGTMPELGANPWSTNGYGTDNIVKADGFAGNDPALNYPSVGQYLPWELSTSTGPAPGGPFAVAFDILEISGSGALGFDFQIEYVAEDGQWESIYGPLLISIGSEGVTEVRLGSFSDPAPFPVPILEAHTGSAPTPQTVVVAVTGSAVEYYLDGYLLRSDPSAGGSRAGDSITVYVRTHTYSPIVGTVYATPFVLDSIEVFGTAAYSDSRTPGEAAAVAPSTRFGRPQTSELSFSAGDSTAGYRAPPFLNMILYGSGSQEPQLAGTTSLGAIAHFGSPSGGVVGNAEGSLQLVMYGGYTPPPAGGLGFPLAALYYLQTSVSPGGGWGTPSVVWLPTTHFGQPDVHTTFTGTAEAALTAVSVGLPARTTITTAVSAEPSTVVSPAYFPSNQWLVDASLGQGTMFGAGYIQAVAPDDYLVEAGSAVFGAVGVPSVLGALTSSGFSTGAWGAPTARFVARQAGATPFATLGVASLRGTHSASAWGSTVFGEARSVRTTYAAAYYRAARFGKPTSDILGTQKAKALAGSTRMGRPSCRTGWFKSPDGFTTGAFGTPQASNIYRALHIPPRVRFGKGLLRRNPIC